MSTTDVMDASLALTEGSALHTLRRQRPKILQATQGSCDAMFAPQACDIPVPERLLIALQVCRLAGAHRLADHYQASLAAAGPGTGLQTDAAAGAAPVGSRLAALLGFAANMSLHPMKGNEAQIRALQAQGLAARDIVALAQLIAFVAYQMRVHEGLRALSQAGMAEEPTAVAPTAAGAAAHGAGALLPNPIRLRGFTNEVLDWRPWLEPVRLESATAEQLASLDAMNATAKDQAYFRLLAHQPDMLTQRSIAYNAIMFAPGGLPRAERELAATVESRLNGCVYCASVHAQRYEQLTKRNDLIARVFDDPLRAGSSPREQFIVRFSAVLALTPAELGTEHVRDARKAGLGDAELLDLVHAVAVFAWANRLMLNLGEAIHLDGTVAERGQP